MSKNINNEEVKVPKGLCLNDKDYLTNLLTLLKDMEKNLAVALTECSNEVLYKEYKKMFDEYSDFQRKTYELMFKFGFYKLEEANKTKICNLISNLEEQVNELN